jgi:hypothetical protein
MLKHIDFLVCAALVCLVALQTAVSLGQELVVVPFAGGSGGANEVKVMPTNQTIEQFLDRMLHESVYDRRIRPFYSSDSRSEYTLFFGFN